MYSLCSKTFFIAVFCIFVRTSFSTACVDENNNTGQVGPCGECCSRQTGLLCGASLDCGGVCDGTGAIDECGNCIEPQGVDCMCSNVYDACIINSGGCEICGQLCDTSLDECQAKCDLLFGFTDCNGDCRGTATINECGLCVGGNTGLPLNHGKDVCGVCGGDGSTCCNCPRSQGYWGSHHCNAKNNALLRDWPAPHSDCTTQYCGIQWVDILNSPTRGNAWNILAKQTVAGKLNIALTPCFKDSASKTTVESYIQQAETLLNANCAGIPPGHTDRSFALFLKDVINDFNDISDDALLSPICSDQDETNDGPDSNLYP